MQKLPIKHFTDIEHEARIICYTAKCLVEKHFQRANMEVLPKPPARVVLPELDYNEAFWRQIMKTNHVDLIKPFPTDCLNFAENRLQPWNQQEIEIQAKLVKEWEALEPDLLTNISWLDPDNKLSQIRQVQVWWARYGTIGSFYVQKIKGKYDIVLTQRLDLPVTYLAKTLLLSIYRIYQPITDETGEDKWLYQQKTIQYLAQHTRLAEMFKDPMQHCPGFVKGEVHKRSVDYLRTLGFESKTPIKLESDQTILVNNKPVNQLFSPQEKKILTQMLIRPGLMSYDVIAKLMWGNESYNKYSQYAIAKIVEGIRKKLFRLGIHEELIHTSRGQGYYFDSYGSISRGGGN